MLEPLVLLILDGWGIAPASSSNAISLAKTPNYLKLIKDFPHTSLDAHGEYVGLPDSQVGNSEAGHMNIGAGRLVVQDSVIISRTIDDSTFFDNSALTKIAELIKSHKSKFHLMGILSGDQCPHMNPKHLLALLDFSARQKIKDVVLHFFTDGRDSPPQSALLHWQSILSKIKPGVRVGSVSGRLYLDRKRKWSRTEQIYNLLTLGQTKFRANSLESAVKQAYTRGETDEFISPTLIDNKELSLIDDKDAVIFFNLRSDRARQLTKAFVSNNFNGFKREKALPNLLFVTMTDFGPRDTLVAFPSADISSTLPMALSSLRQVYIAETEKYAHITYFFNGGYESPVAGEDRILVKSPDVKSYDTTPAMSLADIVKISTKNLENNLYDVYVINIANPDMIGHTGNVKVAVTACEEVDKALGQIYRAVNQKGGALVLTADHGNIEQMIDPITGGPHTQHTVNKVPFILAVKEFKHKQLKQKVGASLANIAPTILDLLDLPKPLEMIGDSLL